MKNQVFLNVYPEQFNYKIDGNSIQYRNNLKSNDYPNYTHPFSKNINQKDNKYCYKILNSDDDRAYIETSYYIGIDLLPNTNSVIHVSPKIDTNDYEVDYFSIVQEALTGNLNSEDTRGLFRIDFDKHQIEINQEDDYLSPLLFAQFLNLLKMIVKKGLRKSFYKKRENLNAKVRGKILVGSSVKNNLLKGRVDKTVCEYQEYGLNHIQNRVLKKALEFVASNIFNHCSFEALKKNIAYCKPFFDKVDSNVDENQIRNYKSNPFFAEYTQAVQLAKLILKRYGFKIENTTKTKVSSPPFWIDMSKVFELYVYRKLKEICKEVKYESNINGYKPDFLIKSDNFTGVIDAKYKPRYKNESIAIDDIRQVSAYSRMSGVYTHLEAEDRNRLLDCLIIYSDQSLDNFDIDINQKVALSNYERFYKLGFKLPVKK